MALIKKVEPHRLTKMSMRSVAMKINEVTKLTKIYTLGDIDSAGDEVRSKPPAVGAFFQNLLAHRQSQRSGFVEEPYNMCVFVNKKFNGIVSR